MGNKQQRPKEENDKKPQEEEKKEITLEQVDFLTLLMEQMGR